MRVSKRCILFLLFSFLVLEAIFSKTTADAIRFKQEYESLNGMPRSTTVFALYNTTLIPENNPVCYRNAKEACQLLEAESAVIYFGANWCPWCRNIIPILLEEVTKAGRETLFYVDVTDERDTFALQDNKPVQTEPGTEGYRQLLEALDAYLAPYTLTGEDGLIQTGEKRILIPFLVIIEKGSIRKAELCTYPLEENQSKYDALTKAQSDALHARFGSLLQVE